MQLNRNKYQSIMPSELLRTKKCTVNCVVDFTNNEVRGWRHLNEIYILREDKYFSRGNPCLQVVVNIKLHLHAEQSFN